MTLNSPSMPFIFDHIKFSMSITKALFLRLKVIKKVLQTPWF